MKYKFTGIQNKNYLIYTEFSELHKEKMLNILYRFETCDIVTEQCLPTYGIY